MNLNQVNLVGRLTKDPELKKTTTGKDVANFSMATNRAWTDQNGQKQELTEFHNIVVWGKLAELANKYLIKGQEALVRGRLQTRNYEAKDKSKRYITEIVAEDIQFGQKPQKVVDKGRAEEVPAVEEKEEQVNSEDLPF